MTKKKLKQVIDKIIIKCLETGLLAPSEPCPKIVAWKIVVNTFNNGKIVLNFNSISTQFGLLDLERLKLVRSLFSAVLPNCQIFYKLRKTFWVLI